MSRLTLALFVTGAVWAASSVVLVVLLLVEGARATPLLRERAAEVPNWLRAHDPEAAARETELTALRDELRDLRARFEGRAPAAPDR